MEDCEKVKGLKEMIEYVKSKNKLNKTDEVLIKNWERSIKIIVTYE